MHECAPQKSCWGPQNIQDEVDTPFWAPPWGDLKAVDIHDSDGSRAA